MADIRVVPALTKHVGRIANRMREVDRVECEAMGRSPKRALRLGILTSEKAFTALVDGQPEAMFGVVTECALSRRATPWFLGTDEVYRHGRELVRHGHAWLSVLGDSSLCLSNLVSAQNDRAIRLLKRWGFTVEDEEVIVRGVPFLRFEKAPG